MPDTPFDSPLDISDTTIGKYQLLRVLGRGGMGIVYLAYDYNLERHVALKSLRKEYSQSEMRSRLLKEAKIQASLNHQNIVQLHDFVEVGEQLALVMEYVKGETLASEMNRGNYTASQALNWIKQIAGGLAVAHQSAIVHRDLKAENILISDTGMAKISDFGIARIAKESHSMQALPMGSYLSLSPEQIKGEPLDARCDLFALGLLAYQLFYSCHPFGTLDNPAGLLHALAYGDIKPAPQSQTGLPSFLEKLIWQLLAKNPNDRPGSAEMLLDSFALVSFSGEKTSRSTGLNTEKTWPGNTLALKPPGVSKDYFSWENNILKGELFSGKYSTKRKLMCAVVALTFIAVLFSFSPWLSSLLRSEPTYVAVIKPVLSSDGGAYIELHRQTASAVRDALEQYIIYSPSLSLIPRSDLSEKHTNVAALGRAVQANVLMYAELSCSAASCNISLEKIDEENWQVVKKLSWRVLAEKVLDTHITVVQKLQENVFDNSKNNKEIYTQISRENYKKYLSLAEHGEEENKKSADKLLGELDQLLASSPQFLPLYRLYLEIARSAWYETSENRYLLKLSDVLESGRYLLPESAEYIGFGFELYHAQSNLEKASLQFSRMAKYEMRADVNYHYQGRLAELSGKSADAIRLYQKSLALRPSLQVNRALAIQQWSSGDLPALAVTFEKLFQLSPEDYWALSLQASIALSAGKLHAAATIQKKLLGQRQTAKNHSDLGLVYMLAGEYALAQEEFNLARNLSPERMAHLLNLADLKLILGQVDESTNMYMRIIAESENFSQEDFETQINLVQALAHTGQIGDALRQTQVLLKTFPDNPNVKFTAALVYTLIGEYQSALVHVSHAVDSGVGAIWFFLPWFRPLCQFTEFHTLTSSLESLTFCEVRI